MKAEWKNNKYFWALEPLPSGFSASIFDNIAHIEWCKKHLNTSPQPEFDVIINGDAIYVGLEGPYPDPTIAIENLLGVRPALLSQRNSARFKTLEEAKAYCEKRLTENVLKVADALGLQIST